jgi:stage V sporulation protein AA
MNPVLYLQLDRNIRVCHPHVYLQDIAKLSCSDPRILHRVRVLQIAELDPGKPCRYVMSVSDLIAALQKKEPELAIMPLGETDFILTYDTKASSGMIKDWCKTFFVCLCTFFGSAFSIMTFNNDVDVSGLFRQIYTQVTGQPSSGCTILEISYSAGIALGVMFFFNHFGHRKSNGDPTPMQVQMRLYENDVDSTIIEDMSRQQPEDSQH